MNKPPTMILNIVLDKSGSMGSRQKPTIDGFNEYIQGCKKDNSDNTVLASLVQFNEEVQSVMELQDLKDIPDLTEETYSPRGSTALLDAIGYCVEQVETLVDEKKWRPAILCVIITDGHENSSHQYSSDAIKKMIAEKEAQGNWTFVYLGADPDAWNVASGMGFAAQNSAQYNVNDMKGTYRSLSVQTSNYVKGVSEGVLASDSFFAGSKDFVGRGIDITGISEDDTQVITDSQDSTSKDTN